jgi:UDP-N-acetylmuramoylalanine--D-glutamate ligase
VLFIADSKATNAHAAHASLASLDSIVWIVGGLLKGVDPTPLLLEHGHKLKAAVVIGADTLELEGLFGNLLPNLPLKVVSGDRVMEQAVGFALEFSGPGDTVLLAPAAASMDQFQDYADRGKQFQAEVRRQVIK